MPSSQSASRITVARCTGCQTILPEGARSHECYRTTEQVLGGRYGVKDVQRGHYSDTELVDFALIEGSERPHDA